ncbi:MAG: flavin reductase family protein, partial [Chloroflexi bacterium]|nr:flavin reductase family protein [Chloroflexota bacterium]
VTASHEDERGGMIAVSAFAASIVPEQPRLMVEIQKRNHTHGLITTSERFAVNVLRRERWEWVRDFGFVSQAEGDKFSDAIPWHEGPHGIPVLDDAIGTLVCRVVNAMDGGDMTVFLAVVEEAERLREEEPVYWSEVRPLLPEEWVEEYGRKLSHDVPDSASRMGEIDFRPWRGED